MAEEWPDFSPPAVSGEMSFFGASSLREEAPKKNDIAAGGPHSSAAEEEPKNEVLIRVEELHAFAAVEEPGADPLLGDEDVCVLARDGFLTTYGTVGTAKTTAAVDRTAHYAAGDPWMGLAVPSPCNVLVCENEGPRGRFRKKLAAKLEAWDGSPIEKGRVHVISEPWGMFRFDNTRLRAELTALIDDLAVDIVVAGPIKRLGVQGGDARRGAGIFAPA